MVDKSSLLWFKGLDVWIDEQIRSLEAIYQLIDQAESEAGECQCGVVEKLKEIIALEIDNAMLVEEIETKR